MSPADATEPRAASGRTVGPVTVAAVVAVVLALSVAGWLVLRGPTYAMLYTDLPLEASAAVVAELEAEGTPFHLVDGGTRIDVPVGEVDRLRVAFSSRSGALTGTDGFELFNESEMGLTEFTQRIKFQRALQGELARTIMAMDGVREARVHLAMPERSLFRSDRSSGKAAVTVRTQSGALPSDSMVLGIQQLVAAAVPDLSVDRVVVLSARGEPVSATAADLAVSARVTGTGLVPRELAVRLRDAVAAIAPGYGIDLQAEAGGSATDGSGAPVGTGAADGTGAVAGPRPEAAGVRVTVRLRTSSELTQDQRQQAAAALDRIARDAGFAGADLLYLAPPLPEPPPVVADWTAPGVPGPARTGEGPDAGTPDAAGAALDWLLGPTGRWFGLVLLALLAAGLVGLGLWRGRSRSASGDGPAGGAEEDREVIEELRQALARHRAAGTGGAGVR